MSDSGEWAKAYALDLSVERADWLKHGRAAGPIRNQTMLDKYVPDLYAKSQGKIIKNPLVIPNTTYPRAVRGGSWDDDPEDLRSAARRGSEKDWKMADPQIPQSIWYHTDALTVGFRIVRPLKEPTDEEKKQYASDKIQAEF